MALPASGDVMPLFIAELRAVMDWVRCVRAVSVSAVSLV